MTTAVSSTALATIQPAFTDAERLADLASQLIARHRVVVLCQLSGGPAGLGQVTDSPQRGADMVAQLFGGLSGMGKFGAMLSGGTLDFSDAGDWSCPLTFPSGDTPPSGVKLPQNEGQSPA